MAVISIGHGSEAPGDLGGEARLPPDLLGEASSNVIVTAVLFCIGGANCFRGLSLCQRHH